MRQQSQPAGVLGCQLAASRVLRRQSRRRGCPDGSATVRSGPQRAEHTRTPTTQERLAALHGVREQINALFDDYAANSVPTRAQSRCGTRSLQFVHSDRSRSRTPRHRAGLHARPRLASTPCHETPDSFAYQDYPGVDTERGSCISGTAGVHGWNLPGESFPKSGLLCIRERRRSEGRCERHQHLEALSSDSSRALGCPAHASRTTRAPESCQPGSWGRRSPGWSTGSCPRCAHRQGPGGAVRAPGCRR